MKQIVIPRNGNSNVLEVVEKSNPDPGSNEVVVDVKAAGINFADILARKGLYPDAPKLPCVVGYEVSGIVEKIGKSVASSWMGKEVIVVTRFGGYSSKVVAPITNVFIKPSKITFEEAASIPVVYLTAYQLIVVMGALHKDDSILIHNVGGGVGLAALDIAKKIGAITYGTSSPQKHEFLSKRGLDHPIDYRNFDWLQILNEKTQNQGVELVIDPIGGNHWKKSFRALRSTGRLGMFGVSTISSASTSNKIKRNLQIIKTFMQMPKFGPLSLMNSNNGVFGVNLGHLWDEIGKISKWMHKILDGVNDGWVCPHVDKTFSFENVHEAHDYIENRKNIGKVILIPT